MDASLLMQSIAAVPPGRWGVGVSGGADSIALLLLIHRRTDVHLHIVHLDHETRDGESGVDAGFVAELAAKLNVPCTIQRRTLIESSFAKILKNTASRFRRARFALFSEVVADKRLQGILLAHHADDQIETVLMRLLRGSRAENIRGMQFKSTLRQLQILRPLLEVKSIDLKNFLRQNAQPWREDSSNRSKKYQRNRVRHWLEQKDNLSPLLADLASASGDVRNWLATTAPVLADSFSIAALNDLALPLARHTAARWLLKHGAPPDQMTRQACDRLIQMAADAAAPPRQHFPGKLLVRRRKGFISVEK